MKEHEKVELKRIFKELKNGNKEVIEDLYNKYKRTIYGVAFSILKNNEDAEDIVQIVFSKLYTMDKEKLPRDKETTWLYTVTKNETLSLLRKKNNDIDLDTIYDLKNDNNEIDYLIDKEAYNNLLSKLNSKEKEIVSLKIISNLSFEEISELLGEKTGTVKWRYYKSICTLRLLLSNLSMSIIAFIISIYTLKNTKKSANEEIKQEVADNEVETAEDINEIYRDEVLNKNENQTQENIIVQEPMIENNINYLGFGFLSLSFIFLALTIIFTIIWKKHQLNSRKKSSK